MAGCTEIRWYDMPDRILSAQMYRACLHEIMPAGCLGFDKEMCHMIDIHCRED